jgi:hypothetical protein
MASITSPTRPDSNYYVNIVQQADLTWTADEMLLDDVQVQRISAMDPLPIPGLRTLTGYSVTNQAQQLIYQYAPPDLQRNFLYTLSTTTTGTPWTNAKAAMDWIAAVNAFRDNEIANVKTLSFAQLQAYVIPVGVPPWPAPPASLPPVVPR